MKKDMKIEKKYKENPRKTWGGVTNKHWEYLKADGEKNRSEVTVWRARQDHLVAMAKQMLASKLDFIRLREDADGTEETHYRISDQLLADYYNVRFPERKISGDALQRTRDIQKRYAENPSSAARCNDGAHSLHFDEACNLALIADIAFVPVGEKDVRSAIEAKNLTTLLGIILDTVQSVVDDTREVIDVKGAEIHRTRVLHLLFCYIDEYARKLAHAELDEMTDEDIQNREENLRQLASELELAEGYYGYMAEPQKMLCMSMLNAMKTTVSMLIEKTDFEAVIRGVEPNSNRQDEVEAFHKIERMLRRADNDRVFSKNLHNESGAEDKDEDIYEEGNHYEEEADEDAAMEEIREELEAERHRKHED